MNSTTSRYRYCLLGLGFSVFLFTLDLSIVNVALPTLVRELGTDFATVQWVVVSYLVVVAALLPGAARLGDLYDKKRLYLGGLGVFTGASVLCGVSPTVEVLIVARALQGVGAAFLSALGMAIVTELAPSKERGRAIGIVGGLISIGVAVGPTVGGLLLKLASWPWIFMVNVPLGGLCWWLLAHHLPELPPGSERPEFDTTGMVLLAGSLVSLELGFNRLQRVGPDDAVALCLVGGSLLVAALFLFWERRQSHPLIALALFRRPQFALGLALAVMVFVVLAGSLLLMPFFLETALGYDTLKVGLLLAVAPVAAGTVSPLAGSLADRLGERRVSVVGLGLLSVACFAISRFHAEMGVGRFVLAYLPFGLGVGIFQASNNSIIMGSAPRRRSGTASGLLSLSRTLGQSLGLPLMATVFLLVAGGQGGEVSHLTPSQLVHGLRTTFLGASAVLAIAALVAARLRHAGDQG